MRQKNMTFKQKIIERDSLKDVLNFVKDKRILILTGIRRCGKSTLLNEMMQRTSQYCYVNFEDEGFLDFKVQDFEPLNEVLVEVYNNPKIYFFDEIQNIDRFELFVRRLQDEGKKIIITGSNASLLSKELGTRLTGRYKTFEIYPFSFKEYIRFKNISDSDIYSIEKKVVIIKAFKEYFENGGFPEYLQNNDQGYLKTIYENILYRDIIARYNIKKQKTVKELVNILSSNIAALFTYNSLKKSVGLSNSITVKEYIFYLSNAYLFFELLKFDYSIRKQFNAPRKIYIIDNSLKKIGLNFSPNNGRLLENIIFLHLKRKDKELYYYSSKGECDFVVREGVKIIEAIQVCYVLNEENKEREINGLLEAMKEFKLKEGLIITLEEEDEFVVDGKKIKVVPAWKWMLD